MKNFLFLLVVFLILADGVILVVRPTIHAVLVNRWNAVLGNPHRIALEPYHGARWRVAGLVMIVTCAYVILKTVV